MKRFSRGFTLIELLVVIAIVVTLAALVFTFVKRGTETAYSARCMNNLKQICITHSAITHDNGGSFVHPGRSRMYGTGNRGWAMHFTAYMNPDIDAKKWSEVNDQVDSVEMLNCPAAYAEHKLEMADHNGHARWRTYGINTRIGSAPDQYNGGGGDSVGGWINGATRPDQVQDPSLLVIAADTAWNGTAYRNAFGPNNVKDNGLGEHHNGGFHVGYADSHVEKHTLKSFPFPTNTLTDGREMPTWGRVNTNPRTPEEIYLSLTWRGTTFARSIPSSPP